MSPTYAPGERVTAVRRWRRVRPGDVVALLDPRDHARWLLKRCAARVGTDLDLCGDSPGESTDSREFGLVPERSIRWIVLAPRPPRES